MQVVNKNETGNTPRARGARYFGGLSRIEDLWPVAPALNSTKRVHVSLVCSPASWERAEQVRLTLARERSIEILHREFVEAALLRGTRLEASQEALAAAARDGWSGTAREGRRSAWVSVALWDWALAAAVALSTPEGEVRRTRLAGALVGAMGDLRQEDVAQEIATLRLAQLSGM